MLTSMSALAVGISEVIHGSDLPETPQEYRYQWLQFSDLLLGTVCLFGVMS